MRRLYDSIMQGRPIRQTPPDLRVQSAREQEEWKRIGWQREHRRKQVSEPKRISMKRRLPQGLKQEARPGDRRHELYQEGVETGAARDWHPIFILQHPPEIVQVALNGSRAHPDHRHRAEPYVQPLPGFRALLAGRLVWQENAAQQQDHRERTDGR